MSNNTNLASSDLRRRGEPRRYTAQISNPSQSALTPLALWPVNLEQTMQVYFDSIGATLVQRPLSRCFDDAEESRVLPGGRRWQD